VDLISISVGKSWLACALGHKACRDDFSVLYHRMPRLFVALALARGDGRYARLLRTLARTDLLILDDWGPQQLNAEQRRDLLEGMRGRLHRNPHFARQKPALLVSHVASATKMMTHTKSGNRRGRWGWPAGISWWRLSHRNM
jgi:hypothetical protein